MCLDVVEHDRLGLVERDCRRPRLLGAPSWMASDAAVSRKLCGVILSPSVSTAESKTSRRQLRLRRGVPVTEGKTNPSGLHWAL
jgi:hypothetical protein